MTSILLSRTGKSAKILMVTSALPQEGNAGWTQFVPVQSNAEYEFSASINRQQVL
ncbi:MAG: hypothetical protein WCA20_10840 [Candidatus Sulfotelmatobacter sp.]